jgi:hypothetical protein
MGTERGVVIGKNALASTPGHALSFDFSFSNTVGATVTGEIDGLQDNATGPARQIPGSCGRAATVKGSRIVV